MNRSDGVVVRIEGEYAWVRADVAGPACGACAQREHCPTSGSGTVLDGLVSRGERLLRLPNTIHARPGDAVTVCAADGAVLRAAGLLYGLPLLAALLGALFSSALFGSEAAALLGMLTGLVAGFLFVRQGRLDQACREPILSMMFKQTC